VKEFTTTNLDVGTAYEFRVKSVYQVSSSNPSSPVSLVTLDGITSDPHPPVFWNTSFVHPIVISRVSQLNSLVVSGVPSGLNYNSNTRTISGKLGTEGVYNINIKATFKTGRVVSQKLVLRAIRPAAAPIAGSAFADSQVNVGATTPVSLSGKFSDPDVPDARRFTTNLGSFDIVLYSSATPLTVNNFIAYVNAGRFQNTFFHRSVNDFVVQGGGYQHTPAGGFKKVPAFATIKNEAGISNLAGTVAMAKIGGNPDSATSEFFVNLQDANAANLDFQNEGFTVFGRLAGDGLALFNQINDKPTKDYTLTVDGSSRTLDDLPVNASSAPTSLDPALLIKITSVSEVSPLRYEVRSSSPGVATAAVSGGNVNVTGVASGTTTITVEAIDLDGNKISQDFDVTVP
jgi:cyclophilin family peptidyl-prolyl cis-trans isomerase